MTPGPVKIVKTKGTGTLVKLETLMSGNTFGATFWTDGKQEAPMLPDNPWLRRHPKTDELFWTDECEEVDEVSPWGGGDSEKDGKYAEVPLAAHPELADWRRALDEGVAATEEQRRYLLVGFWWSANDEVRRGTAEAPVAPDYAEKLAALRRALNVEDANQRLMAAEAAREAGDFAGAEQLLNFEFPEEWGIAVKLIARLVRERDVLVRELKAE